MNVIFVGSLGTIYNHIFAVINQLFDGLSDGLFYTGNEINYYVKQIELIGIETN